MQLFWVLDKKESAVSAGDPNRTAHNPMLHAILYDFFTVLQVLSCYTMTLILVLIIMIKITVIMITIKVIMTIITIINNDHNNNNHNILEEEQFINMSNC